MHIQKWIQTRRNVYLLIGLFTVNLQGCSVGPDFKAPKAPKTKTYSDQKIPSKTVHTSGVGGEAQVLALGEEIPSKWWNLFQSKALNELIAKGLAHSPSLKAAEAALQQSKENINAYVGSSLYPAITGTVSGTRQAISSSSFGAANPTTTLFTLYNASVNGSYSLDFFGKGRRALEGLRAQSEYQRYLLEATYLTLTSNIVTTAITEASLRGQIQATEGLIKLNEEVLRITRLQFELGAISQTSILAQESQLAEIRATLPPLQKNLSITRHALSILVGELPTENQLPKFYFEGIKLPRKIPVSLPSSLIHQRPDIRASESLLHQASANVGVATANLYPQVTITASFGTEKYKIEDLLKGGGLVWSYGSNILQPIFNGGSLRAARRASIEAYKQAEAQYRQTVLQGFQNVADQLRALELDAEGLKAQSEFERAAETTLNLVRKQYQLGAIDYLNLLNAERQYQLARINRIQAQTLRYTDTVALFQALGGGWWSCDRKAN